MIKNLLAKLKESFKEYLINHLGTNIVLVIVVFLIASLNIDDPSETMFKIIVSTLIMAIFTLLGETYTKDNKKRYIIYGVGLIISGVIGWQFLEVDLIRYVIGLVSILVFIIIYLIINKSKLATNKYLTNCITNVFKLGIIGAVINMGIMAILGIFSALILELDYSIFMKTELIILVLYYIPALIISLEMVDIEESNFIYALINYVILPLVTIATAIIYLYVIKLLITLKLPQTAIFGINAALLMVGIPLVLMVLSYEKNKTTRKIAIVLKYLFMPLVLLQIFALTLRISDYGITTSRYLGVILIMLGIASSLLLIKDNGKNYKHILILLSIISLVMFIAPYINIIDYPNTCQIKRLVKVLPEGKKYEDLTSKEKGTVISIYYYVSDNKYYPKYLSREDLGKQIYKHNNTYDNDYYERDYIYYDFSEERINVSEYKEIEPYYSSSYDFIIEVDKKEYDLSSFCKDIYDYYKENKEIKNYIKNNQIIRLDDKTDLYIKEITLRYKSEELTIEGYILYK